MFIALRINRKGFLLFLSYDTDRGSKGSRGSMGSNPSYPWQNNYPLNVFLISILSYFFILHYTAKMGI